MSDLFGMWESVQEMKERKKETNKQTNKQTNKTKQNKTKNQCMKNVVFVYAYMQRRHKISTQRIYHRIQCNHFQVGSHSGNEDWFQC